MSEKLSFAILVIATKSYDGVAISTQTLNFITKAEAEEALSAIKLQAEKLRSSSVEALRLYKE